MADSRADRDGPFSARCPSCRPYVRLSDAAFGEVLQRRIYRLVGGIRDPVPFVETLVSREASFCTPEVPLAEHAGGITGIGEHLGHGHFPLHEAVHALAQWYRAITAADCVAARHQCRPGWCALDFHVEVR